LLPIYYESVMIYSFIHKNSIKLLLAAVVISFGLLFLPKITLAHPGNTDSSGGHYCWTNCTSWGLSYGQYHYHSGSSLPTYTSPIYTPPVYTPTIYVKPFVIFKKVGYNKLVLTGSSSQYLLTYGFGCSSYDFYEGQTIYIDTYSSPGFLDDIYSSTYESSKECSVSSSEELSLKSYYVRSVIDSEDNIIVVDSYGSEYLVEYGIGCLSMWRHEGKIIYIDIGGIFLDGIGDTIYLFDSDDDCRVWDADLVGSTPSYTYTPTPVVTTPIVPPAPVVSIIQPIATLSADKTVINNGESIILTWTSLNGTSVTSNFGAVGLSGSIVAKPIITTTYTITVKNNSSGKTDAKSIIVSVSGIVSGIELGGGAHPAGTVILGPDGKTVYLISGVGRKGFATQEEYNSQGYNLSEIVTASSADLLLPDNGVVPFADGTLVLDTTDGKTIYIINNGTKRGFTSSSIFTGLGYKFSQAVKGNLSYYPSGEAIGSASERHPEGALVKIGTDTYKISPAGKQLVRNANILKSWNWSTAKAVAANSADIASTTLEAVKYRDGSLLKIPAGTLYIMSNGTLRLFSSMSSFTAFGYKSSNVINVTDAEILYYSVGAGL